MKKKLSLMSVLFLGGFMSVPAYSMPTVLEVFTKDNCTAMAEIKADVETLLHSAAPEDEIIVQFCHITGESRVADICRQRVKSYRHSLLKSPIYGAGLGGPGVVVNGALSFAVNTGELIPAAVNMVKVHQKVYPIGIQKSGSALMLDLPKLDYAHRPEAQIFTIRDGFLSEQMASQFENNFQDFTLERAVVDMVPFHDWNGQKMQVSVPIVDIPADGYTVLVNDSRSGEIIAAGQLIIDKSE